MYERLFRMLNSDLIGIIAIYDLIESLTTILAAAALTVKFCPHLTTHYSTRKLLNYLDCTLILCYLFLIVQLQEGLT